MATGDFEHLESVESVVRGWALPEGTLAVDVDVFDDHVEDWGGYNIYDIVVYLKGAEAAVRIGEYARNA